MQTHQWPPKFCQHHNGHQSVSKTPKCHQCISSYQTFISVLRVTNRHQSAKAVRIHLSAIQLFIEAPKTPATDQNLHTLPISLSTSWRTGLGLYFQQSRDTRHVRVLSNKESALNCYVIIIINNDTLANTDLFRLAFFCFANYHHVISK